MITKFESLDFRKPKSYYDGKFMLKTGEGKFIIKLIKEISHH